MSLFQKETDLEGLPQLNPNYGQEPQQKPEETPTFVPNEAAKPPVGVPAPELPPMQNTSELLTQAENPSTPNTTEVPPVAPQPQANNQKTKEMVEGKKVGRIVLGIIVGVIVLAIGIVAIIRFINTWSKKPDVVDNPGTPVVVDPGTPKKISLQLAIDQWLNNQKNKDDSSIIIYDLDNGEIVGRHNEYAEFNMQSIFKMFVAYEGYYRIDKGTWDANQEYNIGTNFQGKKFTRAICLDEMIRYSNTPCANAVLKDIGVTTMQNIINDSGYQKTRIDGQEKLTSATDLMKLYQKYWSRADLSDDSMEKIKDSMLNQPLEPYTGEKINFRVGLPSGFNTAKVYDKVGLFHLPEGWLHYDDAAFVTFPQTKDKDTDEIVPERNYIVIALTQWTDYKQLSALGRNIESAVKVADNYN